MQSITIGTCGWSYPEWKGVFYPERTPTGDFLRHYAEHYAIVEVDSTFYRQPSVSMVKGWAQKTPAGFRFSLKVPQVITHEKQLRDCTAETEIFLGAARLLGEKLLCAVLQFGYFNRQAFAGQAEFLERLEPYLAQWPAEVPLAVEIRNKNWINEAFAECLRRHRAIWVLSDQAWMPSPLEILDRLDAVTGPFAYVRLLGDRAAVDALTKELNRIVIDRGEQIRQDAEAIVRLARRVPVAAFVNNHFAGYSPETIRELQARIEEIRS
jgi:uncharacterized protein YecE (DUF72 family)